MIDSDSYCISGKSILISLLIQILILVCYLCWIGQGDEVYFFIGLVMVLAGIGYVINSSFRMLVLLAAIVLNAPGINSMFSLDVREGFVRYTIITPLDVLCIISLLFIFLDHVLDKRRDSTGGKVGVHFFLVHLLAFSIIVSSFFSLSTGTGISNFIAACVLAGRFVISWWLVTSYFTNVYRIKVFFIVLFFWASLLCIRSIQFFSQSVPSIFFVRAGTLGFTPNLFAGFLILIFPVLMAMFYYYTKPIIRAVLLVTGFLFLIGLILTLSRAGFVGFVFGFSLMSITALPRKIVIGVIVLSLLVVAFLFLFTENVSFERYKTILDPEFGSNQLRFEIWRAATETAKHNWFLGVGYFQVYKRSIQWAGEKFLHAHNLFLQFLVEFGIISFLLISTLVAVFLRRIKKILFMSGERGNKDLILYKGIGVGVAVFLITQLVSYTIWVPKMLYIFLIVLYLFLHVTDTFLEEEPSG